MYSFTVLCFVLFGIISTCITLISSFYNTFEQVNVLKGHSRDTKNDGLGTAVPGDSLDHLFWFIHISDLHISKFHDPHRVTDLKEFCFHLNEIFKPKVVIASGDLTDAKSINGISSQQYKEEWAEYQNVIKRCTVNKNISWLDIRGNHDNFNVLNINSSQNYFRTHSVQGSKFSGSYAFTVKNGIDKYKFVGIDACVETGLRRPFNFVGVIDKNKYNWLEQHANDKDVNGTLWFGHYTTSTILSPSPGIRHLMRNGIAYFCGHLHTFFGSVPKMQAIHQNGLLELEVGDWKESRVFRIGALDHNLLSFNDFKFNKWPAILITNPKDAGYFSPNSDPIHKIRLSTHIRVLVFSPYEMKQVKIKVGDSEWKNARLVSSPLYILPWEPHLFESGIHSIKVMAIDAANNVATENIRFSIDGSRPRISLIGRMALMSHVSWFQVIFAVEVLFLALFLCALRFVKYSSLKNILPIFKEHVYFLKLASCIDSLFYPMVYLILYPAVGPWFIGYLVEQHIGVVFVWGIFVNQNFIPGSLSYVYGCFMMIFFVLPACLSISQCLKYREKSFSSNSCFNIFHFIKKYVFFVSICIYQFMLITSLCTSYGIIVAFTSFSFLWNFVIFLIIHFHAANLPRHAFPVNIRI